MRAAIIDLETTGLLMHPRAKPRTQPRCIEFGAVVIDENGQQLDTKELLIYPEQKLEPIITKITGLADEDLRGKPVFAEVAAEISELINGCDVAIAHNLPFDKGVLDWEFELIGFDHRWPEILLCTVQENVPVYGYRIKLKDLYKEVTGNVWTQQHRALDDCQALAEIVIHEGYLELLS
jgi:DNA polymerase III epsilon subunit-like protein